MRRGIIGFLGFPDDDAVLDEHVKGTGAGAVDAVGGAGHLVVLPAAAE